MSQASSPAVAEVIEFYRKSGKGFAVYTEPLYSTAPILGKVVDASPAGTAFVLFEKDQTLNWFDYQQRQQYPTLCAAPVATQESATEWHTNLVEVSKTPMNQDFAINQFGCMVHRARCQFGTIPPYATTPEVIAGFQGLVAMVDPAALYLPPQVGSPFNLEDLFGQALRSSILADIKWGDKKNSSSLGMLDHIPDNSAQSYLRASGEPTIENGLALPGGYIWKGSELGTDSKMAVVGVLHRDVLVPINLPQWPGTDVFATPSRIILDIRLSAHGVGCVFSGKNN